MTKIMNAKMLSLEQVQFPLINAKKRVLHSKNPFKVKQIPPSLPYELKK